jgi:hypothetical protein
MEQENAEASDFDSVYIKPKPKMLESDESGGGSLDPAASARTSLPPRAMAELLNKSNDFLLVSSNDAHFNTPSLAYWFGLSRFVVITPTRANNYIDTEGRANIVLSSATIAINNTGCPMPVFVQVSANHRELYVGMCEGSALRTHFQIVHFNYTPPQYAHLTGLLEIFKSKMVSSLFLNGATAINLTTNNLCFFCDI